VVLYPALAAEILGMVLDQDQPIPLIKDKIEPQGPAKDKDAAAQNVNIKPFGISGVDAPTIVHANNDEINKIDDIDGNIMSIATVPRVNNLNPLVLPDASDKDNADADNNKSSNKDKIRNNNSSHESNLGTQGEIQWTSKRRIQQRVKIK
jgi:hypothetical protein